MNRSSGIKVLDEVEGEGETARKGDRLVYNTRIFLNKGEEVPLNTKQAEYLPREMVRVEGGLPFIDHRIVLGRREVIAGIERALTGMKAGGYRKVRISPHLAYRDKGIPHLIPAAAVLVVEIWLRQIVCTRKVRSQ